MGVNIAGLDVVLMQSCPRDVMSADQQLGRAGRKRERPGAPFPRCRQTSSWILATDVVQVLASDLVVVVASAAVVVVSKCKGLSSLVQTLRIQPPDNF